MGRTKKDFLKRHGEAGIRKLQLIHANPDVRCTACNTSEDMLKRMRAQLDQLREENIRLRSKLLRIGDVLEM